MSLSMYDELFVTSAIIFFLSTTGIFLSQKKGYNKLVRGFGIAMLSLTIPLALVFINYLLIGQELWVMIYLVIIFAYFLVELLLDFVFHFEFRKKPSTHIPYIILYYATSLGFIGISFYIDMICGWIISISFWAVLASLTYLYVCKKTKK